MRISKVVIQNYRSLSENTIYLNPLVAIIGENNSGKSNILTALALFFSASKKDLTEECFAFGECKNTITIEVTFVDLNALEKQEFSKGNWILSNGSVCIKRTFYCTEDGGYEIDTFGLKEEPAASYLKEENVSTYAKKETLKQYDLPDYFSAESGRVTQVSFREGIKQYISENRADLEFEQSWIKNPKGYKEVLIGALPEYFLVPAVRDVSAEEKVTTTTLFGRIMNAVIARILAQNESVSEVSEQIRQLAERLNRATEGEDTRFRELSELEHELTAVLGECMPDTAVNLEISPPDLERIFQTGTRIRLDDGIDTYLESKGHGMQRAMLFSLFRCYANLIQGRVEAPEGTNPDDWRKSFIFAIEEPELFLHPQLQRRMYELLKTISQREQILYCTHSPSFVHMEEYASLVLVTKPSRDKGSNVRQHLREIFPRNDDRSVFRLLNEFDPERSEMFFGKKVALVEGDVEKVSLPLVARILGIHRHEVSIIECGGKYNLPFYIRVLLAFGLPFAVIHDEDPIPDEMQRDTDEYRNRKRTYNLNQEISSLVNSPGKAHMLSPDFETIAGISKNQGRIHGKPFAAFLHFREKSAEHIPLKLREIVQDIYGA